MLQFCDFNGANKSDAYVQGLIRESGYSTILFLQMFCSYNFLQKTLKKAGLSIVEFCQVNIIASIFMK